MRLTITLMLAAVFMIACSGKSDTSTLSGKTYGSAFTLDETMTLTAAAASFDDLQGQEICLDGTIEMMCMHKGDWIVWSEGVNQVIVQFKDHAYTIPTDSNNKRVLVQGFLRDKPLPPNCDNAEKEQHQALQADIESEHADHDHADHAEKVADEPAEQDDAQQGDQTDADESAEEDEVNRMYFLATAVKIID
jgi:hypothetical protein